jgi:hypothetical protein
VAVARRPRLLHGRLQRLQPRRRQRRHRHPAPVGVGVRRGNDVVVRQICEYVNNWAPIFLTTLVLTDLLEYCV